jgi:hypothetical protein
MKVNSILSFSFAAIIFMSLSCTKEVTVPDLDGSLVGFVYTYDEYGNPLENHDNVLITAIGTGEFTTKTDANGRFEFKGLPAGTYEIDMEKEGFGTMKQFGVQHLGGKPTLLGQSEYDNILSAFSLIQTPTSSINGLSLVNDTLTATIDFHGKDPSNVHYRVMVYFSRSENFDLNDAEYSTESYTISNGGLYKGKIYDLESKFDSGTLLSYKACILISGYGPHRVPVGSVESYFDYSLNEMIYPNLGPESNEYSYVVP